jgi:hypothetical protein
MKKAANNLKSTVNGSTSGPGLQSASSHPVAHGGTGARVNNTPVLSSNRRTLSNTTSDDESEQTASTNSQAATPRPASSSPAQSSRLTVKTPASASSSSSSSSSKPLKPILSTSSGASSKSKPTVASPLIDSDDEPVTCMLKAKAKAKANVIASTKSKPIMAFPTIDSDDDDKTVTHIPKANASSSSKPVKPSKPTSVTNASFSSSSSSKPTPSSGNADSDSDYESEPEAQSEPIKVDHQAIIDAPLTKAMIAAYRKEEKNDGNKADVTLCVLKAAELILAELGIPPKRFYSGCLKEVVLAAERGDTLNSKLQGYDAKTANNDRIEYKTSSSHLGERTNINFPLPDEGPLTKTANAYYKAFENKMISEKGNKVIISHSYSSSASNEYQLSMRFLCFYARLKDVRCFSTNSPSDRTKCTNMNIGAMPCKKCTKVHRLCRLMEFEAEWAKIDHTRPLTANERTYWANKFNAKVKQSCK